MSSPQIEQPETNEVAGFIAKTFEILNNDEFSKIIYWAPSGLEFVIKDVAKFQQVVLPRYFRHNKINSFIRQLNMYGFHKSRTDHTKSVFSHANFIKDRQDLLITVKRKIKNKLNQEQTVGTPLKSNKKSQIKEGTKKCLVETGNELSTARKSSNHFSFAEPLNNTSFNLLNLIESKQKMPSRMNLNFSIQQLSQSELPEMFGMKEDSNEDCISIEDKIQGGQRVEQRVERRSDRLSLKYIMTPSCFFTSIRK